MEFEQYINCLQFRSLFCSRTVRVTFLGAAMFAAGGDDRFQLVPCMICKGNIISQAEIVFKGSAACHEYCASGDRYLRDQAKKSNSVPQLVEYATTHPKEYGVQLMDLGVDFDHEDARLRSKTPRRAQVALVKQRKAKQHNERRHILHQMKFQKPSRLLHRSLLPVHRVSGLVQCGNFSS